MKKFWKKTEGFTLVELIVVIAILGILAGVGTVGYSGYIAKANKAADEILLDSLNTAFAAACIENGVDSSEVSASGITIGDDKTVAKADINVTNPSAKATVIQDAFEKYYESGEFKVYSNLRFRNGMFVGNVSGGYSYGGGTIYVSEADIAALKASTFYTKVGLEGLLNKVNDVTTFAAAFTGSNMMQQVFASDDFRAYAAAAMGMDPNSTSADFNEKLVQLAGNDTAKQQEVLANAAVLYAANNAIAMNQSDIITLLSTDGAKGTITSNLSSDPGVALSQAALAYGMFTSYAHHSGEQDLIDATDDPISILNRLDDDGFQAYMQSEQGKTDLKGYLSSLNMVEDSTNDTDAVTSVLQNGFADPDLLEVLKGAIG